MLRPWFKREKPDVITTSGEADCIKIAGLLNLTIPGKIGFTLRTRHATCSIAGIDERPHEIGSAAKELLHTKLLTGSCGVPAVPTLAMVPGQWVPEPSVSQQQKPSASR